MQIHNFDMTKHYDLMLSWLKLWKSYLPAKEEMPAIGFVAYSGGTPVAMAFLRRVEGGHGQLDGLVTNPNAPGLMRHAGIGKAVDRVAKAAKEAGIKSLIAFTVDDSVLKRAPRHGFTVTNHSVLVRQIAHKP